MSQKVYSTTKKKKKKRKKKEKKRTPASQTETHQSRTDHACPAIELLQSHLLRHFPYLNQSRTHLVAACHVSCCQLKFQSIFNPCNPLQHTMGNNINIKLWSEITKLDYYFWNSTDAKKSFGFFKKIANNMRQSHNAGGKDPALS